MRNRLDRQDIRRIATVSIKEESVHANGEKVDRIKYNEANFTSTIDWTGERKDEKWRCSRVNFNKETTGTNFLE